jgi:hypothetical protein
MEECAAVNYYRTRYQKDRKRVINATSKCMTEISLEYLKKSYRKLFSKSAAFSRES